VFLPPQPTLTNIFINDRKFKSKMEVGIEWYDVQTKFHENMLIFLNVIRGGDTKNLPIK